MWKRKKLARTLALLLLVAYAGSYLGLSRRGYAEADRYGLAGFYYFPPEDADAWRFKNYGCVLLFKPLNWADRALGLGRYPASEPLWGLRSGTPTPAPGEGNPRNPFRSPLYGAVVRW